LALLSYGVLLFLRCYKGSLLVSLRRNGICLLILGSVVGIILIGLIGSGLDAIKDFAVWVQKDKPDMILKIKSYRVGEIVKLVIAIGLIMSLGLNVWIGKALYQSNKSTRTGDVFRQRETLSSKASWIFFVVLGTVLRNSANAKWIKMTQKRREKLAIASLSNILGVVSAGYSLSLSPTLEVSDKIFLQFFSNWTVFATVSYHDRHPNNKSLIFFINACKDD
jgi:hypothetical protein